MIKEKNYEFFEQYIEDYLTMLFKKMVIKNNVSIKDSTTIWDGFFLLNNNPDEEDKYRLILGHGVGDKHWFYCGEYFGHINEFFNITIPEFKKILKSFIEKNYGVKIERIT